MHDIRSASRLACATIALLLFAGCATSSNKWTLWYVPNETAHGASPCKTYVFASSPGQQHFAVAKIDGWTGTNKPQGNTAVMHSGEDFTGTFALGQQTVHDDSNGYDLGVNVVYEVAPYVTAKARADADCPAHK
jgi:hypothetical protein